MHDSDREQEESKEEQFTHSKHPIETEAVEHGTECTNTTERSHIETHATDQSYQKNNINNDYNMNGNVDSMDCTHHFMSVEALCQAHHVISQGILLNRMQRLEEAFRNTLSINDKNADVFGIVEKDDNNNDKSNKRHKRGREIDEKNDNNLSKKASEDVPLLSLLRKHPILQNYIQASSYEHTTKLLSSELISKESSVQMQTENHNKSNDNKESGVQNEDDDNNADDNVSEMNTAIDDKCIMESMNNSREVSVNTESSSRQGHAVRKRSRNNDNDRRKGGRRITYKTPLASLSFSSSTITATAAVNDEHVLRSLSKFNELVKPTTHWYCQESEMCRRGVLRELVTCESMSNVSFHRAVEQYIVTVQEARNVLQRAYPIFYDNAYHHHHHHHDAIHSVNGREPSITLENKDNATGEEHPMQANTLLHEPQTICVHDCDIPIAPAALFNVTMKELHGCEANALLHLFGVYQEYEKQILQKMSSSDNNGNRQEHWEDAEDSKADILYLNEKRCESDKIGSSHVSESKKVDKMNYAISNYNNFGSNINVNEFSSTVQALVEEVKVAIPFRCTRLCKACQAGWLLPEPLPLHTLTSTASNNYNSGDDDDKDNRIDKRIIRKSSNLAEKMSVIEESTNVTNTKNAVEADQNNKKQSRRGRKSTNACKDKESSKAMKSALAVCTAPAAAETKLNSAYDKGNNNEIVTNESVLQSKTTKDALGKVHNVDNTELLSYVHKSGVCNRAFSHLGESVLLSLPRHVHKLHREVEEELEKYLFDSGYALMEDDGMAGELVQQIRRVYTQNLLLSRYVRRVQHIEENLHKVVGTDARSSLEKLQEHDNHHHRNSREHTRKSAKRAL